LLQHARSGHVKSPKKNKSKARVFTSNSRRRKNAQNIKNNE